MHITVLENEALEALALGPGMTIVDATLGEGGHALRIGEAIGSEGRLVAIDRDRESIERAKAKLAGAPCQIDYVQGNFADVPMILTDLGITTIDGILFDLGWNTGQFESSGRGFSFTKDEPLLMTFEADQDEGTLTAYEIVNSWSEADIAKILWGYGEERASRRIARAIAETRKKKPIVTSGELADLIEGVVGRHGKTHPATRSFQALRIAVNDELKSLSLGLEAGLAALAPGRRIAVISFHSLEDRIVKHFMKRAEDDGRLKKISKKPIIASDEELQANPRARSAKLRIAEKI